MKKILAFAAVAVAAVALASADPILVAHGYFGVGLGSTVTYADGSAMSSDKYSWNFVSNLDFGAGIGVNIPFAGYFGFQPGIDFYVNNVGYSYKDGPTTAFGVTTETKFDMTHRYMSLDIPLLLTAKLNKFNFALGPYVSIPVGNVTRERKGNTITKMGSTTSDTKLDRSEEYEHSWGSIGLLVGMGYEQRMGMGRLVIGGNYMLDFIPIEVIMKESDGTKTTLSKLTRRALKVDVAYKLPLSF